MWNVYLSVLAIMLGLSVTAWLFSLHERNVNIVDSLWALMFRAGGGSVIAGAPEISVKA